MAPYLARDALGSSKKKSKKGSKSQPKKKMSNVGTDRDL